MFCAGVGNEDLLRRLGVNPDEYSQRRPLHMVMARHAPAELFGHCIRPGSDKPRLTVTTSRMAGTGELVWYLGGDLAESGVERSSGAQIEFAKREVAACLPWLEVGGVAWSTLRIDRAEGLTPRGGRPDGPVCARFGNAVAVWPTKLVLAPAAAGMALAEIGRIRGAASAGTRDAAPSDAPPIAPAPWEDAAWT